MDLSTTYMGMKLKNPLVPSASPLSSKLDTALRLEDAGASAIVMYSLFEEQILNDQHTLDHTLTTYNEAFAEAINYFPEPEEYTNLHAEEYLEQIRRLKKHLGIPVIASLNGVSSGGWMDFAKQMEEAGADAIELNIYYMATDPAMDSSQVELNYLNDIRAVKQSCSIPIAVKVGPYFSAFANMAIKMVDAGASALVLFNRFYQPDINLSDFTIEPSLQFSSDFEKRLPMRWIAILYGQVHASLAATTGVHSAEDAIKMILCGADVAMLASTLLKHGPQRLQNILDGMEQWMIDYEYESIEQLKGSMGYQNVAEPSAFERANYLRILQSFKV